MANAGQAILTIGGTIVGAYFGNPQLGYLLGSMAGQALFPTQLPTIKGPRLTDAKVQTSTLGAPIPWVWGTYILAGEMIWRSPFIERKVKEKAGGKGGPEQTSIHYEYRANIAIGLCKGEIIGIRRIWADTKLIYDASRASTLTATAIDPADLGGPGGTLRDAISRLAASLVTSQHFDLYLGTETQDPDPTIETWEGVGNVPGYRGLAYVVFRDFELADYGNRIPNFRIEVMTAGTIGDASVNLYSNDVLYPWQYQVTPGVQDPRNPNNGHVYGYIENSGTVTHTFISAMADMNSQSDHPNQPFVCGEVPQLDDSLYIHGWSNSTTPNYIQPCDPEQPALDYIQVEMTLNAVRITPDYCSYEVDPANDCAAWWGFLGARHAPRYVSAGQFSGVLVATHHDEDPAPWFGGVPYTSVDSSRWLNNCNIGGEIFDVWRLQSHELSVIRTLTPPNPCSGDFPIPGTTEFCATPDGEIVPSVTWTLTGGNWHALRSYGTTGVLVTSYPLNPARPSTDAQYNDQDFWEAAYAAAVAAGDIEAGLVYGVDYPMLQTHGYVGTIGGTVADPDPIPLSEIVADICEGCGLFEYDVQDLESVLVQGYALTQPMTGKDGIDPLRPFGYFDAVESELEYRFVRRGHPSVMTIDPDDLRARLNTEDMPPAMTTVRAQDPELPRIVRAHFIDWTRDGDVGQAEQQRQIVDSVNSADLQVPVVMTQARGQAMVDTILFERWIGRNSYQCALPFKYIKIEPTDCIDVLVDGVTERMRITQQEVRALAVLEISAVRDDVSIYGSTDLLIDPADTGSTMPIGNVPSPTELILLELPALRSQDTDCGYYAAARGLLPGWAGAIIYRATSISGTFRQVAWTSVAATIGIVDEDVSVGFNSGTGGTGTGTGTSLTSGIDLLTVARIQLYSGTFESVSEADLIAGENLIAVGTEGDWELIRFQLAVQGSDGIWEVSNLLRAQLGTTQRTIVQGDRVVLMTGPGIMRIDESESVEGVERVIRAVTSGTSLEDAEDHTIATTCLSRPSGESTGAGSTIVAVKSRSVDAAPPSPACDDAYIVPDSSPPTPADDPWFGHVGTLARYDCVTLAWEFTDPTIGPLIYVEDENLHVYFDGADFIESTIIISTSGRVLGRKSSGSGGVEELTTSEVLDFLGSAVHGVVLYRDAAGWAVLSVGTAGQVLQTNGADADPSWVSPAGGGGVAGTGIRNVQTAEQSVTSSTTFVDGSGMTVELEAGKTYEFEVYVTLLSNSTPKLKDRLHYTGTIDYVTYYGLAGINTTQVFGAQYTALDVEGSITTTVETVGFYKGTIKTTTAGTFSFQFAQQTSSGTAITLHKGSRITAIEI